MASQAKSSSIGFLVITKSSAAESFDEIDYVFVGVSNNHIDLSILHHKPEAPFSSYGSTPPISGDDLTSQSQLEEEESESCTWKKLWFKPTLPICLKFEDVTYKVPVKGEVLALMGPLGGGETTLLNLLSGRVKFHSVKETLTYIVLLCLPNTLTMQQKKERATSVISELGLVRCQNTVIGGTFSRGISGGERKRVCIANEILLNPSLLLLDEPTSGLDSTTALQILQMLRSIARSGRIVVTTIHQPSSRLFSKFDNLILLGKGNSLYFGKALDAMLYFSSIGCSPLIAMNPAEFLIDLANGNTKDKSVPSNLVDKFFPRNTSLDMKHGEPFQVDVYEVNIECPK
ncbi:hypothetical protein V6N11_069343 [Hibiscus sabdariffa]|uniref:ABC transporter domain-containing protein n=2 Tax=Hibiscus sabdariffa TaxID=183260 RepID=A0ABR1ZRF6_9ROSI